MTNWQNTVKKPFGLFVRTECGFTPVSVKDQRRGGGKEENKRLEHFTQRRDCIGIEFRRCTIKTCTAYWIPNLWIFMERVCTAYSSEFNGTEGVGVIDSMAWNWFRTYASFSGWWSWVTCLVLMSLIMDTGTFSILGMHNFFCDSPKSAVN